MDESLFTNVLIKVFDINDNIYNNIDLYILNKLKHNGYLYLIKVWIKIEDLNNVDLIIKNNIITYFDSFLKLYIIENDYTKGTTFFLEKLCYQDTSNINKISFIFFNKCIDMLKDSELNYFLSRLFLLLNSSKFTLENVIHFYKIINNNSKLYEYMINSDEWLLSSSYKNEYISHIGRLYNKLYKKIDLNESILLTNKCISDLCKNNIKINIYNWFVSGINLNKHKLQILNSEEYLYSDIFLLKINCSLEYLINIEKQNPDFYINIDNNDYNLNNIKDNNSCLFFINYWYFLIGIKYIISDYINYIKEIYYVDTKIYEILKSKWWNDKHSLRIDYISKLKRKKYSYQKKKNKYSILLEITNIIDNYINSCEIISEAVLQNNKLFENEELVNSLIDSYITIFKYNNNLIINKSLDIVIKILSDYSNLNIQYKCIEYLVNYLPSLNITSIENKNFKENILDKIISIYNNTEKYQNDEFYERFEPRYYISFLIRFLLDNESYSDLYIKYSNENISNYNSFIIYSLNDSSELLHEIIYNFEKINTINSNDDSEITKEEDLLKIYKLIETFYTFFTENILLLKNITNINTNKLVLTNDIYNKYIEIIDNNNIDFNLKIVLKNYLSIVIDLNSNNYFNKLLLQTEIDYSYNLFTKIKTILFSTSIYSWRSYYKLIELEEINSMNINNNIEKNIPDKFLDPLLNTLIINPVILPGSNIFIDLSTIETHLKTNGFDPFNRTPLTLEKITNHNNKPDIIYKIQEFKNELQQFLN